MKNIVKDTTGIRKISRYFLFHFIQLSIKNVFCSTAIYYLIFSLILSGNIYAESVVTTDHFVVINKGKGREYAERVSVVAEKSYGEISAFLRHGAINRITIVLASDDKMFSELTQGSLPDWSAAVAIGNDRIIVSPLAGGKFVPEQVIPHEITHSLLSDAVGGTAVPRWFHEGCAEFFSERIGIRDDLYLVWQVAHDRELTFADIENVFSKPNMDASLAYDQSLLAVQYLISVHGKTIIPLIIDNIRNEGDFHRAFLKSTGVWPVEFEKSYDGYLKKKYGKIVLFTVIPSVWTIILFLAIIVYFIKMHINRKKIRRWAEIEENENVIDFDTYRKEQDE